MPSGDWENVVGDLIFTAHAIIWAKVVNVNGSGQSMLRVVEVVNRAGIALADSNGVSGVKVVSKTVVLVLAQDWEGGVGDVVVAVSVLAVLIVVFVPIENNHKVI